MLNSGDHMTEYLDQAIQGRDLSIFAPTPTWVSGSIEAVDMRDQTARPKRRRISQACNPCRSRKMRCDGHRPACSRCQKKKGVQCVYEESSLNLKKYLADSKFRTTRTSQNKKVSSHSRSAPIGDADGKSIEPSFPSFGKSVGIDDSNYIATDALNITPFPENDVVYIHGGSSASSFVRSVLQTVNTAHRTNAIPNLEFGLTSPDIVNGNTHVRNFEQNICTLPRRKVADSFVNCFFELMHPMFPILHRSSFMTTYERLWVSDLGEESDNEVEDPCFIATVNIIFAIGCQFDEQNSSAGRTALADRFYQQSTSLFTIEFLDSPSLPVIQLLLLTGVYLQSTQHASRCWQTIGMAVRAAQEIGLHLENRYPTSESQHQREIRRRVWHTCVILDRLLALTFNRPVMISPEPMVPLPQILDDEVLLPEGNKPQSRHTESRIALFVYSIKLFDILHEILVTIYNISERNYENEITSCRWWSGQRLHSMLRLNAALDDLLETVPIHLKLNVGQTTDDGCQLMQSNVFQARFLYIRVLLLRPVILAAAQGRNINPLPEEILSEPRLEQQVTTMICTLCVSTVHKLVDRLYKTFNTIHRISAWHTVHYTFACSVVLVAARLCRISDPDFSDNAFETSWSQSFTILEHYRPQIKSAAYAIKILLRLYDQVESMKNDVSFSTLQTVSGVESERQGISENIGFWEGWLSSAQPEPHQLLPHGDVADHMFAHTWPSEQVVNLDWLEL